MQRRLLFIDALRAFAILMMLQGHFITTTLAKEFHAPGHWLYDSWAFMRGLTAPIFFTVTGIVFVYLLLGETKTSNILQHKRWRKGIRRGFFLILLGYSLRLNIISVVFLHFRDSMFQTDVLHCIGLGLIFLCGLYALAHQSAKSFATLLTISGLLIFGTAPLLAAIELEGIALPFRHYVNKQHGAVFSPLPWLGYCCFGGLIGMVCRKYAGLMYGWKTPLLIGLSGWAVQRFSSSWWMSIHRWTDLELLRDLAYQNTCFIRFGQCLIIISLFILATRKLDRLPTWITKTGSETLTIYAAHYVLLYGAWFGLGLKLFFLANLTPLLASFGAALFVGLGVLLACKLEQLRQSKWHYRLTNLPTRMIAPWR